MSEVFQVSEAYCARRVGLERVEELAGYRMKVYSIRYSEAPVDWAAIEAVKPMVEDLLPQPAVTRRRPGVGFIIIHEGRGITYFVTNWWDAENELVTDVLVRKHGESERTDASDRCSAGEGSSDVDSAGEGGSGRTHRVGRDGEDQRDAADGPQGDGEGWRPARGSESVCVWDLEVIWFERNLYVERVLSRPGAPGVDEYVAEHFRQSE